MMYSFPNLKLVCRSMSSSILLLICIQVSQEAGKVVWYSLLFKNFSQFVLIHTVKGFKAEVDVILEFPCFLYDPMNVGNQLLHPKYVEPLGWKALHGHLGHHVSPRLDFPTPASVLRAAPLTDDSTLCRVVFQKLGCVLGIKGKGEEKGDTSLGCFFWHILHSRQSRSRVVHKTHCLRT